MFKNEAFSKNKRSHIVDISESRASLTGVLFFENNEEFGQNCILGQAPSLIVTNDYLKQSRTGQYAWGFYCLRKSNKEHTGLVDNPVRENGARRLSENRQFF